MCLGGRVPPERRPRSLRPARGGGERGRIGEQPGGGVGERVHVARRHNLACVELTHELAERADVRDDHRSSVAERGREHTGGVAFAVRQNDDRRRGHQRRDLGVRYAAQTPVDPVRDAELLRQPTRRLH